MYRTPLITLTFIFLFEGISCIKKLRVKIIVDMLQRNNLFFVIMTVTYQANRYHPNTT